MVFVSRIRIQTQTEYKQIKISWIPITFGLLLLSCIGLCSGNSSRPPLQSLLSQRREGRNILENFAVDRVLSDRSFVISLIDCVMDRGPCDGNGKTLKRLAPEVIRGHCPGCDKTARTRIHRVLSHVQRNFPREWKEVMDRYLRRASNPNFMFAGAR